LLTERRLVHSVFLQEFKCHKAILAIASSMFEVMFCSNFKEAKMDPDEPIVLDDVTPEAFDCAMR